MHSVISCKIYPVLKVLSSSTSCSRTTKLKKNREEFKEFLKLNYTLLAFFFSKAWNSVLNLK